MNGRSGGFSNIFLVSDLNGYSLLINLGLSSPDSFFEQFFNPYPSTGFLRQAQDGAGRTD
ncbi:MAG: hypothetical protein LBD67_11030 [Candidatus Accumulibacter sp.]|nr:hypothetical protein [Accumulibacter sp.]